MTYLQLVNQVLNRLREDEVPSNPSDPTNFLTDPYYKSIGAHVNDAKDRVEDSWQWGALRGTDVFKIIAGTGSQFELPNSADNHYILKRVLYHEDDGTGLAPASSAYYMRQTTVDDIRRRYLIPDNVSAGKPYLFAVTGIDATTQNIAITVFPPLADDAWLEVDRVKHQDQLVSEDDKLLVPSLPVYSLATALASRERGEVGGTPTSELFGIADSHLSDAIAQDSALYANEVEFYSAGDQWVNTNVRAA